MDAQHHVLKRKRIYQKKEIFPHPEKRKRYLDYAVLAMGVIAPLMTFTQVFKIWDAKSAEGVSPITWITYFVSSIIWLMYGLEHKEKPIILANFLYIIGTLLILVGIIIY